MRWRRHKTGSAPWFRTAFETATVRDILRCGERCRPRCKRPPPAECQCGIPRDRAEHGAEHVKRFAAEWAAPIQRRVRDLNPAAHRNGSTVKSTECLIEIC